MLVFASDIHLTDGTCGTSIDIGAFDKFNKQIVEMAEKANAKNVEIAFLGDIFDIIRSSFWLCTENSYLENPIRPWSPLDEKDAVGRDLKYYVIKILKNICMKNKEIHKKLKNLKEQLRLNGIKTTTTYIIGNHDWLINLWPETRMIAEDFLLLDKDCHSIKFKEEISFYEYEVFARHGDIYDSFNHEGNRNKSSLGDAIVIDLINRFPIEVRKNKNIPEETHRDFEEIDNVRPMSDIPDWLLGICKKYGTKTVREVKKTWNKLVKQFLRTEFVRRHDKFMIPDVVDILEIALGMTTVLPLQILNKISLEKIMSASEDYAKYAIKEKELLNNGIRYIAYGHTHYPKIEPLNIINNKDIIYFNTGTWRKVHQKTRFNSRENKFVTWDVMTFVVFYKKEEKKQRNFEVWNGSLY